MTSSYFWIRVFDYDHNRDNAGKGVLLDEYYLSDIVSGRAEAKEKVLERYCSSTATDLKFAKPRKNNGIYAIVMESEKYWYDRFYYHINTLCFMCSKPIKGKAAEFPHSYIGEGFHYTSRDNVFSDLDQTAYFCNRSCQSEFRQIQNGVEGEFQIKEEGGNGEVFGYIYIIYNRVTDMYYIGQTKYLPFFRWQEHIKDGRKGHINDLSFNVLTEVFRDRTKTELENQQYLNSLESWWIDKHELEGYKVSNVSRPKITIEHLKRRFNDMVIRQEQLTFDN